MKKTLFSLALITALIALSSIMAVAQKHPSHLGQTELSAPQPPKLSTQFHVQPQIPSYCQPCLFYGGDFNSTDPNANGLASEKDLIITTGAAVYSPFQVPTGRTWMVRGLFANTLSTVAVIDPARVDWSINSGVSSGNGGTVVASGAGRATYNPTGRNGFGLNEYTALTHTPAPVPLTSGRYWESVVPYCTKSTDPNCGGARYFESERRRHRDEQPWQRAGECLVLELHLLQCELHADVWILGRLRRHRLLSLLGWPAGFTAVS